jgi:hypothetical protein
MCGAASKGRHHVAAFSEDGRLDVLCDNEAFW